MGSQRSGSTALGLKPSFEFHGCSLDDSKPHRQGFSKPASGNLSRKMMDKLTAHRKARLLSLIQGPRFNDNRKKFVEEAKLSKGRISQLLDPDESFGERSAGVLALNLRLPKRYFEEGFVSEDEKSGDYPKGSAKPSPEAALLAEILDWIEDPAVRKEVLHEATQAVRVRMLRAGATPAQVDALPRLPPTGTQGSPAGPGKQTARR
jgi:hypothetical protein